MFVALTFALAYASTNFDNLAVFIALAPSVGARRVALAFASTQVAVILAAVAVGAAADRLPAEWIGFLGVVPILMGLREILKQSRVKESQSREEDLPASQSGASSVTALMLTFAGMSADTFALTATLLADSSERFDRHVLVGAAVALVCLCAVAFATSRVAGKAKAVVSKLDRITPFVMIASGVYILWDTITDVV